MPAGAPDLVHLSPPPGPGPDPRPFLRATENTVYRFISDYKARLAEPIATLAVKGETVYRVRVRGAAAGDQRCQGRQCRSVDSIGWP